MSSVPSRSRPALIAVAGTVVTGAGIAVHLSAVTALGIAVIVAISVIALAGLGLLAVVLLHRSGLPAYRFTVLLGLLRADRGPLPPVDLISSMDRLPASLPAPGEPRGGTVPQSPP